MLLLVENLAYVSPTVEIAPGIPRSPKEMDTPLGAISEDFTITMWCAVLHRSLDCRNPGEGERHLQVQAVVRGISKFWVLGLNRLMMGRRPFCVCLANLSSKLHRAQEEGVLQELQ